VENVQNLGSLTPGETYVLRVDRHLTQHEFASLTERVASIGEPLGIRFILMDKDLELVGAEGLTKHPAFVAAVEQILVDLNARTIKALGWNNGA